MAFDTPAAVAGILFTVAFTQVGVDLVDAMSDGIWQLTRPKAVDAVDGLLLTAGEAAAGLVPDAAAAADRDAGDADAVDRAVRARGADLPRGRAGADGVGDECVAGDRVGAPPRRRAARRAGVLASWRSRWRSPSGSARSAGSVPPATRASRRSSNGLAEFSTLVVGIITFGLAAFMPFLVIKLIPIVEAAVIAQGIQSAPLRAAQTGLQYSYYFQGIHGRLAGTGRGVGGAGTGRADEPAVSVRRPGDRA